MQFFSGRADVKDQKAYSILCVDDEENILNTMKRVFRREGYRIFTTSSTAEAFSILEHHPIQLIISDQRMPQMTGTEFLSIIKDRYPEIIRIILTGYTDVDSITEAVNKGLIYKFLLKPWNDEDLRLDIRQAIDQYELIQANRMLHNRILEQNEQLRLVNETLEEIVRKRTEELEIKNHSLELAQAILEDMPIAVIGVSAEGSVALINREASNLPGMRACIAVGSELTDSMPPDLAVEIMKHMERPEISSLRGWPIGDAIYDIYLSPLSGRFQGRGIVVTMKPLMCFPSCNAVTYSD
jgi:CheY-like chemotaxis protein